MDRQIWAQTTLGQTGKCVFAVVCSYQAGKDEVRTRERVLLHVPGRLPTSRHVYLESMAFFSKMELCLIDIE